MDNSVDLRQKLSVFEGFYAPRTIAQFNGQDVMLAKLKGPFIWHSHDDTDDFFLVVHGTLLIELRDRTITLHEGDLYIVPRGVEHRPVAEEEVHVLLIERSGTPNTGDAATAAPMRRI
jgi:mannose-6-phosphate isomerase-like protein (cupin superfamily)